MQETQPDSDRLPAILQKAVEADPDQPAFRLWLGNAYLTRGKAAEAIPGLEESVRRFPDSAPLRFMLGLACESADRIPEARRHYRRVIESDPTQPDGYVRLANLALREEQVGAAFDLLDEALLKVNEPQGILSLYDLLGEQFLTLGKPWLASICFSRVADRQPDNVAAHERLLKSRLAAGDKAGVRRELEILVAREPGKPERLHMLGELAESEGQTAEAEKWYAKALNSPAARSESAVRLALLQLRHNPSAALETLAACAKRFPDDSRVLVTTGALLFNGGRAAEAIAAFEQAETRLEAAGDKPSGFVSPFFYFWYGAACDQAGLPDRAAALFEKSMRRFPEISEPYNYLAYMWAQKNIRLDEALVLVRKALALSPDTPAYLDTLGYILYRQGDLEGARVELMRAADKLVDEEVALHLGDVLQALGRLDEAKEWWRKSAALAPKGEAAGKLRRLSAPPEASP
ncbi:MAG: tetratricopeptide repeat protein [Kiritimatiellia bacterium]